MNKYLRIALIWTLLTIILSGLSARTASKLVPFNIFGIDKIGHIFFYSIMSYTWICGLRFIRTKTFSILFALFFCNFIGVFMEFYQKTFSDRNFEYDDMLANILGTLIGVIMFNLFYKEKDA